MASESLGPAVKDGKLLYTSPSAINRFAGCPRSWYYRYVERRPDPPSPAAEAGTAAHARIEAHLKTGAELTPHELVGLEYLPLYLAPDVEAPFELDVAGTPVKGKIDILAPGHVTDWKFKTALSHLATPDELKSPLTDVGRQMLAYAAHAELTWSGSVAVQHVYMQLPPKAPKATRVLTTVEQPYEVFTNAIEPLLGDMARVAAAKDARDVEGQADFCWKYHRRCPYMSICPMHAEVDWLSNEGVSSMGLFDSDTEVSLILPPDVPPAPPLEVAAAPEPPKKRKAAPKDLVISPTSVVLGTFLYFGAYPVGVPISTLHGYVDALEKDVLLKFGEKVPDIRLAAHESLKFGKWKAVLAGWVKQLPAPTGYFCVGTEEKELVVADALRAIAPPGTVVFGGVR